MDLASDPKFVTDKRRHPRFELDVDVTVLTDQELLPGRTLEISESGISAILPVELREGAVARENRGAKHREWSDMLNAVGH
jgi:hypothetical protein